MSNCHGRNRSLSSGVKAQTNRVLPHHDGGHHGTGRHGPDHHGAGGDDVVGQGRPWNPRMMSRVPTPQASTGDSWAPSRLFGPRPPSSPKSLRPCLSAAMDDRPEADSQRCHQSELPIDGHENCPVAATISACLETPFSLVLSFWLVETASRSDSSVPEPPEGRHEITQPHVSDGPLKPHSRGTDPVTGCRLPQPGQRRWSSGLGGRAIEALRMDDGLSIGAVRPVETTNGLLIGQRRREAVTAVLRLTRT
jgi:hypothetical protein